MATDWRMSCIVTFAVTIWFFITAEYVAWMGNIFSVFSSLFLSFIIVLFGLHWESLVIVNIWLVIETMVREWVGQYIFWFQLTGISYPNYIWLVDKLDTLSFSICRHSSCIYIYMMLFETNVLFRSRIVWKSCSFSSYFASRVWNTSVTVLSVPIWDRCLDTKSKPEAKWSSCFSDLKCCSRSLFDKLTLSVNLRLSRGHLQRHN